MEVRLLKPHELGVTDSVIDVAPGLANYLVQCNVAEYGKPKIDFDIMPAIAGYEIKVANLIKTEPKKRGPKKKDK